MIRFLLNRQPCSEQHLDPNTTVLEYLRTHVAKTGTKEGCASGDCGACTAVIAQLDGNQLRYHSINTCLTFVSALDGKQLISIEDLQDRGQLHKAQQAMLDCHGSQCGFCTPGFVMSMFALGKNAASVDDGKIHSALGGNLCRCTGYRPIVDATKQMYRDSSSDQFEREQTQTIAQLKSIQPTQIPTVSTQQRRAFSPRTVDELTALMAEHPDAQLVAGGTDLALQVTQLYRPIETLILLSGIDELKQVIHTKEALSLGAALPLTDCAAVLNRHYPDICALLERFASLQIRNQGTLGGNIGNASPIGDMPPALIALDANIELRSATGTRILTLQEYFVDYKVTAQKAGEFISRVIIPAARSAAQLRCYKLSKRFDDDISAVLGCFNTEIERGVIRSVRIAFGGMAGIPKRAQRCEAALLGKVWNAATIAQAKEALAHDFAPLSDFRASSEYRMLCAQNMLTRYYLELTAPNVATQVTAHV